MLRRLVLALAGLWALAVLPAHALTPAQRAVLLAPVTPPTVALDFTKQTYAEKGAGYTLATLPGWSFSRASQETCQWANGTLTYAASGSPCITDLGIGVWQASTNLLLQSQALGTTWALNNGTLTGSQTAPDGTSTAWSLTDNSTNGQHQIVQSATYSSGTAYSLSVYAKAGSASYVLLYSGSASNVGAWFNLSNGSVGTRQANNTSAAITPLTGGWYRCAITFTAVTSGAGNNFVDIETADNTVSYAGVGSNVQIWGAQLEQLSFATPYIPTTSTTATRAADVASLSTGASALVAYPGAMFVRALTTHSPAGPNAEWLIQAGDGTVNNRIGMFRSASSTDAGFRYAVSGAGSNPGNVTGAWSGASVHKGAMAWGPSGVLAYADGVAGSTAAAPTGRPPISYIGIGTDDAGNNQFNGYIQTVTLYPRVRTAAQLQALTH